ncbi:MAG: FMN-binding protein [Gaiellales bacterium]
MNRGFVVIGATVLGIAGLLAFDQLRFGDPFALHSATSGVKLPQGKTFSVGAAADTSGSATTAPADTAQQSQGSTQQAAPAPVKVQRAVGSSVSNPYGNVQVKVTLKGGKLTRVTFLDLPYGDPTSQSISDQVAPVLAQQSIDAQSANIAGVSGATYTSDAYRQSLQSALDKAGFGKQ